MKPPEKEEIEYCEVHKVWYTNELPCKSCKQERKQQKELKQESPK